MSVIASTSLNNDDEMTLDKKTWDKLKKIEAEDLDKYIEVSSNDDSDGSRNYDASLPNMNKSLKTLKAMDDAEQRKNQGKDQESDSDESEDSVARINRMEEEINYNIASKREYQMFKSKKEAKKEIKAKALVELQRQKKKDVSDDEMMENKDIFENKPQPGDDDYSENDDDLEEERMIMNLKKQNVNLKRQKKEEDEDDAEEKLLFQNPLLAFDNKKKNKNKDDDSSEWSDDDKYDPKQTREEKRAEKEKEKKLLGKKRRAGIQGDIDEV